MSTDDWNDDFREEYDALAEDGEAVCGVDALVDDDKTMMQDGCLADDGQTPAQTAGPSLNPRERLDVFLERMAPRRRVLLGIMRFCTEPREADSVLAHIKELQEFDKSVYEASTLCSLLAEAGGLEHLKEDGTPYVEDAGDVTGEDSENHPSAPVGQDRDPMAEQQTPNEDDADADEIVFEEVEAPCVTFWRTTDVGMEVLADNDPKARLWRLLADDIEMVPVYREILENLADAPMGKPQVDAIVRAFGPAEAKGLRGGYFLDRLEKTEAIEWRNPWQITDLGREALEYEGLYD